MNNKTIEERIASALKENTTATATDLAALIAETTAAIDQTAMAERDKALDPMRSPDANVARAAMNDAEFICNRLRTMLPRLQARYTDVEAQEYLARWKADRDDVEKLRDAAAAEFSKCRALMEQIAIIFSNTEAVAKECSRVNGTSPPGQRHIQGPELTARHLAGFSASDPSVLKSTVLFWDGKKIWPPVQKPISVLMASPPQHDARFSSDWHAAHSGADQKDQPNANQKMADYYASLTKEQDERRHREDVADRAAKRSSA